jgi:tRNA1Val (adenine37-N6)-methyltransferase
MKEPIAGPGETGPEVTETSLQSEGLRILQPRYGYRFSIDALLLAAFVHPRKRDRILDLGAGCGVVALVIARRHPHTRITAVEIQEDLAALAGKNVIMNDLKDRLEILEGDLHAITRTLPAGHFDWVTSNPPYRSPLSGRMCKDPQEALARHEILTDLNRLLQSSRHALRPGGRISLVYPAELAAKLISSMRSARLEPKRLRMVHPGPESPAKLILVEGCKDAGEELRVEPPLFLNEKSPTTGRDR